MAGSKTDTATTTLLRIGIILGIGVAGSLDEILVHQLLQWHNFYVHTTDYWRIVSDGLFHVVTSGLLGLGAALLWRHRRLLASLRDGRALLAGILCGAGGFNFYDGTIQHKILQLHPVREGVENILPYDLAWNAIALAVLATGLLLWRGARVREAGAVA